MNLLDVIPVSPLEFLVVCGMMGVLGFALGVCFEYYTKEGVEMIPYLHCVNRECSWLGEAWELVYAADGSGIQCCPVCGCAYFLKGENNEPRN